MCDLMHAQSVAHVLLPSASDDQLPIDGNCATKFTEATHAQDARTWDCCLVRKCVTNQEQANVVLACRVSGVKRRATAHDSSVTGLASDACNKLLVSTGLDGRLCMWDFKQQRLQGEVAVGCAVACLAHHPATSLVALAGDDLMLRM